jgi:hypothetical protein
MSVILLWIVPEGSTMVPVIGVRRQRRARSRYARAVRSHPDDAGCIGEDFRLGFYLRGITDVSPVAYSRGVG